MSYLISLNTARFVPSYIVSKATSNGIVTAARVSSLRLSKNSDASNHQQNLPRGYSHLWAYDLLDDTEDAELAVSEILTTEEVTDEDLAESHETEAEVIEDEEPSRS